MTNKTSVNILMQDIISRLEEIGVHSILVRSKEEAKNFIMYHIDIGTHIIMDDCLELNGLNLERAIIEKGGTILNSKGIGLAAKEEKKRKSTIEELNLYGSSYILEEFNGFTHHDIENNYILNDIDERKTIIVINIGLNDALYNKLLLIYKEIMDIDSRKINNLNPDMTKTNTNLKYLDNRERNIGHKNINNDISIVFIE